MLRYFHFLSKTYFKKWSPYINMVLGMATFMGMMFPIISSANDMGGTAISSINTFTKFFPFLFATLFSALSINHIFKEGEQDGSELIVVAKPLTRIQIIGTKFLMLLTVISLYQLVATAGYIAIAYNDQYATSAERMNFVGSLALGGFIVQIIAASVIVMISAVLGKVGTTTVSILFAAIVPIASFTISPLGGGQAFDIMPNNNEKTYVLKYNGTGNSVDDIVEAKDNYYMTPRSDDEFNAYKSKQWYDKAAFGDIWYQWGRFYSMFTEDRRKESLVQNWVYEDSVVKKGDAMSIHVGSKEYLLGLQGRGFFMSKEAMVPMINTYIKKFTPSLITQLNPMDMKHRYDFIYQNMDSTNVGGFNSADESEKYMVPIIEKLLEDNHSLQPAAALGFLDAAGQPATVNDGRIYADNAQQVTLYEVGAKIKILVAKDFIPTTGVVGAWSVIAVLLVGMSIFVYYRRDFK